MTFDLETIFLALDENQRIHRLPMDESFWANIETSPAATGVLIGIYANREDWPHWEMHPAGDETLILLDGELEIVLDQPGGERRAPFTPGQTLIIPKGVWHRAIVKTPGRMLAITPGAGTAHRPL